MVSVVIASYNGARYLGEAIESVLAQTHPAVETIVVDDGSTDDTAQVVARYGAAVRGLHQPNAGPCVARNLGLRNARGDYVVFLDHDDRLLADKVARQAAVLDARLEVGLVYGGWRFIDDAGNVLAATGWPTREGDLLAEIVLENPIHLASAMVRRSVLDAAGGFDERRTGLEDWELWLRLSRRGLRWACVDAPLVEYRVHRGQRHTRGIERVRDNRLAVLDEFFADPTLAPAIRELAPAAYQNAHLKAAADYFRAGARAEGSAAFGAAVRIRPAILTEPRSLRRFCRLLPSMGYQSQQAVVARWWEAARVLRTAVHDVLAAPDLEPEIARLAVRARLTVLRVTFTLARKRFLARARRQRRR
ncbi:MAG: glycosyltransferase family 2 protein [Acidimicrobiales bacterium]